MEPWTERTVTSAEARRVCDLSMIQADLRRAHRQVALLLAGAEGDLAEALFRSAVTSYARCFAGGVRTRLSADIFGSDSGPARAHSQIYGLRDKFIAHSVNDFEQAQVVVGPPPTFTVDVVVANLSVPPPEGVRAFSRLIDYVLAKVDVMRLDAMAAVERVVQELGPAGVRALPESTFDVADVDVSQRRS